MNNTDPEQSIQLTGFSLMKTRIVHIIGARPQFIKASFVIKALPAYGISSFIIHTGQHYHDNLSAVFFKTMEIPSPDINLEVGSGHHGYQTAKMLTGIEEVLLQQKPNLVMVYGDTNSTLDGALAAVKLHIPVAHVEAGLRSFKRSMPEVINRVLTDHTSDLLFAPTATAVSNLLKEGIAKKRFHNVGDVMYDVALHYGKKA